MAKSLGFLTLAFSVFAAAASSYAQTPGNDELFISLHNLVGASERGEQSVARDNWRHIVKTSGAEDLTTILKALKDPNELTSLAGPDMIGPLTENWLRAAVDAIAERELASTGALPKLELEEFTLDESRSPRARRIAYEWLKRVDESAPSRLLPKMLDDESLELRYEAIAKVMDEAKIATDDDLKLKKFQRALKSARDKTQLKECAEALTELGKKPNMAKQVGFLTNWKVVGPFDNTDRKGFNAIHFDVSIIDFDAEYEGKHGTVRWKEATAEQEDLEKLGYVDLNAALVEEKSVLAYAATTFLSSAKQQVECRYETKEATKLWINGEEVAVNNVYHSGGGFDQYIVPCNFKKGPNQIVIKVCQNEQTQPWTKPWDFRLRVTDSLGGAITQAK